MPATIDQGGKARRTQWVRLARRAAVGVATLALVFTAFMGFLHTKAGRPLMAKVFGAHCPMASATPEAVDRARRMGVLGERGIAPAPARPAFGFQLDATTLAEVRKWAREHDVACEQPKEWLVQCSNVAPEVLGRPAREGRIEELAFGFRPDGRLVNITTLRRGLSADQGNAIAEDIGVHLYAELGKPVPNDGRLGDGQLSSQSLSSRRLSVRYSDYFADVTAMNLPTTGVAVREQYLSAAD